MICPMDNITHSVVGLATGDLIHRSLPSQSDESLNSVRRRLLILTAFLASNFPDIDLLLTPLLPQPLGYLLHHRGHTHTLLFLLPQAALILLTIWGLWPSARLILRKDKTTRKGFAISLSAGLLLHILMDYFNVYGVHPFYPFDSRWFYGDLVFIVEPFFWMVFGVPMIMSIQRRWLRVLLMTTPQLAILGFTLSGFLSWYSFVALSLVALFLGSISLGRTKQRTFTLVLSSILGLAFVGAQSFSLNLAQTSIKTLLNTLDPQSLLLDSALTAFPSNPLCWSFVAIEKNEKMGFYRLRQGVLSTIPNWISAHDCPSQLNPFKMHDPTEKSLIFTMEKTEDLNRIRELKNSNCFFSGWLRFARIPSLTENIATDIRFPDRNSVKNFSTIDLNDFTDTECPTPIPNWAHPRGDLLKKR